MVIPGAIAAPAQARETGLSIGNTLESTVLSGEVQITCFDPRGGIKSNFFTCRRDTLIPAEYSRFQTAEPVDADYVYLRATHEDGSSRDKSGEFIAETGRTKKPINLWVWTLLQRPMLMSGRNEIMYKLTKKDKTVEKGRFTVTVNEGTPRSCERGNIQSNDPNDCDSAAYACDRYFLEYNYCQ